MTAQYTATQQLLPSNVMAETAIPSKTDINAKVADKDAFSKELNKASKNYTDKSEIENKSHKDTDYSKETKNIHSNKEQVETKDNNEKKAEIENSSKSEISTKEQPVENSTTKSEKETAVGSKEIEKTATENITEENQTQEVQKTVEELIEEIKINATAIIEDNKEISSEVTDAENNVQKSKIIATEQLIANVEFENSDIYKSINVSSEKIINKTKSLISENTQIGTAQTLIENNVNIDNIEKVNNINLEQSLIKEDSQLTNQKIDIGQNLEQDIKLNIETKNVNINAENNKTESNAIKQNLNTNSTKDILASDISRLTINLEENTQTDLRLSEELQNTKTIAPADVIENTTPRIQVTEDVAMQVRESLGTGIENKDTASKIKDKAVETMTSLQDKNTVLTESQTYDTNSNNTNLGQNNANETVAKLSVETANFNTTQPQTAESFISRLETHIASRETSTIQNQTINQSDILSQVNAKFEQLQQQANNKVSIVLQPESLGKVSVEIMNTKDGIIAKMTTDTQQVKELFDKNIESLKSNLSAQGVNVNNIKVECAHESTNNAMNFERDQFNQSFNNQQNGHNTNKSEQNAQNTYGSDFGTTSDETTEEQEPQTLKNTETIIKHNGKVDYSV